MKNIDPNMYETTNFLWKPPLPRIPDGSATDEIPEGWDKGPRQPGQRCVQIHKGADWIYRLGRLVVIEARDHGGAVYGMLVIGEGAEAHRLELGPVLNDDNLCISIPDALPEVERCGRKASIEIFDCLQEARE